MSTDCQARRGPAVQMYLALALCVPVNRLAGLYLLVSGMSVCSCGTGLMTASTLRELFAGFRYLHTVVGFVHRDMEDKHVGRADDDGRLCVFDLSTCTSLHPGNSAAAATALGYAGEDCRGFCVNRCCLCRGVSMLFIRIRLNMAGP